MGNYNDLSKAFKNRQTYKYDKHVSFDGTKIVDTRGEWKYDSTKGWYQTSTNPIVLAEWIEYKGRSYAIVYNRSNKCYATDGLMWMGNTWWYKRYKPKLKFGEIGKCSKDQQQGYRGQMIDKLIAFGGVTHILIPTSKSGDSAFFKDL